MRASPMSISLVRTTKLEGERKSSRRTLSSTKPTQKLSGDEDVDEVKETTIAAAVLVIVEELVEEAAGMAAAVLLRMML